MEPGPLPPHERSWRHPSELGPTAADVEATFATGSHTKMVAAASGVLAVMLIVAIVVTATPGQSDAPTALSATTTPVVAFTASTLRPAETTENTRHTIAPAQALLLVSLNAIPNEIASAPQLSLRLPEVARELPKSSEHVMVQTADVTYHCTWADVELLEMPDGTMVVDDDGELVAQVDGGEIVALVDDPMATSPATTPGTTPAPD